MTPELVIAVTALGALGDVGRSLREAFFMFWETLWALVLGFGLSGAVQAFVSRGAMHRMLGNHRPAAIARAAGLGAASSSCSYAASAMAKTLFARGADFLAAMAFMFASTNLVIELGIVLIVLIGWQFAASEFVGGAIMIVLLVALGHVVPRRRLIEAARERLQRPMNDPDDEHGDVGADGRPVRERLTAGPPPPDTPWTELFHIRGSPDWATTSSPAGTAASGSMWMSTSLLGRPTLMASCNTWAVRCAASKLDPAANWTCRSTRCRPPAWRARRLW